MEKSRKASMKKRNSAATLSLIMGLCITTTPYAHASKNGFWEGVGIAAATVAAGIGAWKLAEWCFTESDSQLVIRAKTEYEQALHFSESITFLKNTYHINNAYFCERDTYTITHEINEPVLYGVARYWFDRGISVSAYIDEIIGSEHAIQLLSKTLHTRIDEKKGMYLDAYQARIVSDMRHVLSLIEGYLPHLTLLRNYVSYHSTYFNLFDEEAYLYKQYDTELRITGSMASSYTMMNDIRNSVLWRYSDRKYPLSCFVSEIDSDISSLSYSIRSTSARYVERIGAARYLKDSLDWIKKAVASDERYVQEQYQKEIERLEKARLEAMQQKLDIERMQLAAQQQQNMLLAQNNILQAQHIVQQHTPQQVTVIVK